MATIPNGQSDEGYPGLERWERSTRDDVLRLAEDREKAAAGDALIRAGRVVVAGTQTPEPEPKPVEVAIAVITPGHVITDSEPRPLPPTRHEAIREATRRKRRRAI